LVGRGCGARVGFGFYGGIGERFMPDRLEKTAKETIAV